MSLIVLTKKETNVLIKKNNEKKREQDHCRDNGQLIIKDFYFWMYIFHDKWDHLKVHFN